MKMLRFLSMDEPFLPNSRCSAAIATSLLPACLLQAGLRAGPGEDAGLEEPDGRCLAWEAGTPRASPCACCHGSGKMSVIPVQAAGLAWRACTAEPRGGLRCLACRRIRPSGSIPPWEIGFCEDALVLSDCRIDHLAPRPLLRVAPLLPGTEQAGAGGFPQGLRPSLRSNSLPAPLLVGEAISTCW